MAQQGIDGLILSLLITTRYLEYENQSFHKKFCLVVYGSTVQTFQISYKMRLTLFWTEILQRSDGGGAFQATDLLNGRLLCGCQDIKACSVRQDAFSCYVD